MTTQNTKIKYKVVVEGVTAYTQQFNILGLSIELFPGDVIEGQMSGATGIVLEYVPTGVGLRTVKLERATGVWYDKEDILVLSSSVGEKDSPVITNKANYNNTNFGIVDGTWTFDSDGGLVNELRTAKQKINVAKGGALASGYSFGFKIKNEEFIKTIHSEGVFFNNLVTKLMVEVNSIYTTEWTGIIETFKFSDETTVDVQCTDLTKSLTENIGSDLVPITLNRNYNCKLVLDGEKGDNFDYVTQFDSQKVCYILGKFENKEGSSIHINQSAEITQLIDDGEFINVNVEAVMGKGKGNEYNVVRALNGLWIEGVKYADEFHTIWLDNEDISDLQVFDDSLYASNRETTLILMKQFDFLYNLSQNPVRSVNVNPINPKEIPVHLVADDNVNKYISPTAYEIIDNKQIIVSNILDEQNMNFKTTLDKLDPYITGQNSTATYYSAYMDFEIRLPTASVRKIVDLQNTVDETFFRIKSIKISNAIVSINDPDNNPLEFSTSAMVDNIKNDQQYYKEIAGKQILSRTEYNTDANPWKIIYSGDRETIETTVTFGSEPNSFDFEITTPNWESFKTVFSVDELVDNQLAVTTMLHNMILEFNALPSKIGPINGKNPTRWNEDVFNDSSRANWEFEFVYEGNNSETVDSITVGCYGENVQEGNEFETVGDTVDYLLQTYMGIPPESINTSAFNEADDDLALFPGTTSNNLAHQIVEQSDSNKILKDICFASHMGLYVNRSGLYSLNTWLPKSTVYTDTTSPYIFTEENFESISKITRDNYNNIASDISVETNYKEYAQEFGKTIRVKNTEPENPFNGVDDTEGLEEIDYGIATEAHNLLALGWKRARKTNQLQLENKWLKSSNTDGTGNGDTINWIRNIAGHVNREHEYLTLTVPMNRANLDLELLTFIIVKDQFVTDGDYRKGWIVERTVDTKNHVVIWKILLDINPKDPFFYAIGTLQDVFYPDEGVIIDDQSSTDILQDGNGR